MKTPNVPLALQRPRDRLRAIVSRVATSTRLEALRRGGPLVRRALDVVAASAGLAVASPVLVAAAVAVRATSPGPIFFRQTRVGKDGQHFDIYKFRSMYVDAAQRLESLRAQNESKGGVTFKIRRDPRITPVGRILRKFSIDELPQLYNVLTGTMTVFGPRPPIPSEVAKYGARQRRRLEVTPGLTCYWQVQGRSDLSFDEQVDLDLAYIDTSTAKEEATILMKTVPAVLTGKGAY